jgi:DNA-binding GntR family transcriptional regulator
VRIGELTLDTRTLTDQAFEALEGLIVKGKLPPGARLNELEISRTLGISRGPLREALQRLEGRRLVKRVPHVGVTVMAFSDADVMEMFEIRESLEGLACRMAAERMPDEELEALQHLLDAHRRSAELKAGLGYYQRAGDYDIHFAILGGSGNRQLIELLTEKFYHPLRVFRYLSSTKDHRATDAFDDHQRIIDAMKRRDGTAAEQEMRAHIARARTHLAARLENGAPSEPQDAVVAGAPDPAALQDDMAYRASAIGYGAKQPVSRNRRKRTRK